MVGNARVYPVRKTQRDMYQSQRQRQWASDLYHVFPHIVASFAIVPGVDC